MNDSYEGFVADSSPCLKCGVKPVVENGEFKIYHKHDCVYHWRKVNEGIEKRRRENQKKQRKAELRRRGARRAQTIDYWIHRWSIKDIAFTLFTIAFVIFLILFFAGIVSFGE